MKKLKIVYGAVNPGTKFYKITEDQIVDYFSKSKDPSKIFILSALDLYGWRAFTIDKMYGSQVFDNELYLCVTDNEPIVIDGREVDPESALTTEGYKPEDIENYIAEVDEGILNKYFTEYDLNIEGWDIDEVANACLQNESFSDVVASYLSLGLDKE